MPPLRPVALQGVVEPQMTGIGGDCFVLYSPKAGAPVALNGSGRTPAKTDLAKTMAKGAKALTPTSIEGVTVPGAIDAWCRLAAKHGSKSLEEIFKPAIDAAENGFRITPRVASDWSRNRAKLESNPAAKAYYLPAALRRRSATGAASRRSARRCGVLRVKAARRFTKARSRRNLQACCKAWAVCTPLKIFLRTRRKMSRRFPPAMAAMRFSNVRRTGRGLRR